MGERQEITITVIVEDGKVVGVKPTRSDNEDTELVYVPGPSARIYPDLPNAGGSWEERKKEKQRQDDGYRSEGPHM